MSQHTVIMDMPTKGKLSAHMEHVFLHCTCLKFYFQFHFLNGVMQTRLQQRPNISLNVTSSTVHPCAGYCAFLLRGKQNSIKWREIAERAWYTCFHFWQALTLPGFLVSTTCNILQAQCATARQTHILTALTSSFSWIQFCIFAVGVLQFWCPLWAALLDERMASLKSSSQMFLLAVSHMRTHTEEAHFLFEGAPCCCAKWEVYNHPENTNVKWCFNT